MGCAGHPFVQTPNLDRLALRGVRFTNAYTPSPICVPARASLATGRYAHETGYWDNAMAYDGRVRSWGQVLGEAGVESTSIGKLHYRREEDDTGFSRQIRPMHIKDGVGMVWGSVRNPLPDKARTDDMLSPIGPGLSSYNKYDQAVAEDTVAWLKTPPEGPWCLFSSFVAPHFPLTVPEEYLSLYDEVPLPELHPDRGYERHPRLARQYEFFLHDQQLGSGEARRQAIRAYYALITFLDAQIGRILDALEETGALEDTLIIYTSDHGECLGERGARGKSVLYAEASRVPMIVAGRGLTPGLCATPVSLIDLPATICGHFDVSWEGGADLVQVAQAPDDEGRVVFSEYHAVGAPSGAFMVADAHWAYHHYEGYGPELFDLANDPGQAVNLAGQPHVAQVQARMHAALLQICDPAAVSAQAFADQADLVEAWGGRTAAMGAGPPGATPAPEA